MTDSHEQMLQQLQSEFDGVTAEFRQQFPKADDPRSQSREYFLIDDVQLIAKLAEGAKELKNYERASDLYSLSSGILRFALMPIQGARGNKYAPDRFLASAERFGGLSRGNIQSLVEKLNQQADNRNRLQAAQSLLAYSF